MKNFKIIRKMDACKVREMCIRNGYYTCGDTVAYDKMFTLILPEMPMELVQAVAKDIFDHSSEEYKAEFGSEAEGVCAIMEQLLNECCVVVVVPEEEPEEPEIVTRELLEDFLERTESLLGIAPDEGDCDYAEEELYSEFANLYNALSNFLGK